jgi:hypothetical protein
VHRCTRFVGGLTRSLNRTESVVAGVRVSAGLWNLRMMVDQHDMVNFVDPKRCTPSGQVCTKKDHNATEMFPERDVIRERFYGHICIANIFMVIYFYSARGDFFVYTRQFLGAKDFLP